MKEQKIIIAGNHMFDLNEELRNGWKINTIISAKNGAGLIVSGKEMSNKEAQHCFILEREIQ